MVSIPLMTEFSCLVFLEYSQSLEQNHAVIICISGGFNPLSGINDYSMSFHS